MEQHIFDTIEILAAAVVRLSRRKKQHGKISETKLPNGVGAEKHSERLTHNRREITHVIR